MCEAGRTADPFVAVPCAMAGMRGGCRWHGKRYAPTVCWHVPSFEVADPTKVLEPPRIETAAETELFPTFDGKNWKFGRHTLGTKTTTDAEIAVYEEDTRRAVNAFLDGVDEENSSDE